MTDSSRRPAVRWLAPAAAAVVLTLGVSAAGTLSASAGDGLPARSAAQLLADVQTFTPEGFSGTLEETAALGLPSIPGTGGGSSDLTSLVAGTHRLKVWYADPEHTRVALLGDVGESDVVRDGTTLWTWSSADDTVTRRTLPATPADAPENLDQAIPLTPQIVADAVLGALEPTTRVTTERQTVVAGRAAYELVLTPRGGSTLVGSVRLALDGETRQPLRVQVVPRGAEEPAFEIGFTSFDPTTPDPSVLGFTPPDGATVTRKDTPAMPGATGGERSKDGTKSGGPGAGSGPETVGSGWSSVVVSDLGDGLAALAPAGGTDGPGGADGSGSRDGERGGTAGLLQALQALPTVSGDWGSGHLLRGTLFSVLISDDGRVAVGAVPPDALYAALSR